MKNRRALFAAACLFLSAPVHASDWVGRPFPVSQWIDLEGNPQPLPKGWLVFQAGAVWCFPSEFTAQVFSDIRRNLEGAPFEFLEVFADPGGDDVRLWGHGAFAGLRGLLDAETSAALDLSAYPTWFLIDPDRMIRAWGNTMPADDIRDRLGRAWKNEPRLLQGLEPSSSAQSLLETGLLEVVARDYAKASTRLASYLDQHPDHEFAIMAEATANWSSGVPRKEWIQQLGKRVQQAGGESDAMKLRRLRWFMLTDQFARGRATLLGLREKYPESLYLRLLAMPVEKGVHALGPPDLELLRRDLPLGLGQNEKVFAAVVLNASGDRSAALEKLSKLPHASAYNVVARIFAQSGDRALAFKALGLPDLDAPRPDQNRADVMHAMLAAVTMEEWDRAERYAVRYAEMRPDRVLGPLVQIMVSRMRQDPPADREAVWATVGELVESKPRYAKVKPWHAERTEVQAEQFATIPDYNDRLDAVWLLALRALDDSQPEAARALLEEGLLTLPPNFAGFGPLYVTWLSLTQPAP